MQTTIFMTVVKYLFDLGTHHEAIVGIYRDVTRIEYTVNVFPQKDAIGFDMHPTIRVGTNMSCVQRREHLSF